MRNLIRYYLKAHNVALPSEPIEFSKELREAGIIRSYIIVMTGRCGSTWLASALDQLKGYGNPIEYYSEEALPYYWKYDKPQGSLDVFLGIAMKYSDAGCFGFKINPQRLFWLGELIDLPRTFNPSNTAWIDMKRWNLVKQAFSFVIAKKTGVWHQVGDKTNSSSSCDVGIISDDEVWQYIISILRQEQQINRFYERHDIKPLRIWHEELFDSKAHLLIRVAKHINRDFCGTVGNAVGKTRRLDKDAYSDRELEFVVKHAELINEIYADRAGIDTEDVRRRISAGKKA